MTSIVIAYIVCGVVYLIACVMDGQDVKPLWKKWLGVKLADVADYYYPIDYCRMDKCMYVDLYAKAGIEIHKLKEALRFNKPSFYFPLEEARFDAERIETVAKIDMKQLHDVAWKSKMLGNLKCLAFRMNVCLTTIYRMKRADAKKGC